MTDPALFDDAPRAAIFQVCGEEPGGGSAAGVVITRRELSGRDMQAIARDLGAPTTAFLTLTDGRGGRRVAVRYFSSRAEMSACGYASVAAASLLSGLGLWAVPGPHALSSADGDVVVRLTLDAVHLEVAVHGCRPLQAGESRAVRDLLSLPVDDSWCEIVTTGLRHLIVSVADEAVLSAYAPVRTAVERVGAAFDVHTIALVSDHRDGRSVRLRDLCAPVGDLEEPASGTTSAAVLAVLHRHSGVQELVVRQGEDMGQPCVLRTRVARSGVMEVSGRARLVLSGRLGVLVDHSAPVRCSTRDDATRSRTTSPAEQWRSDAEEGVVATGPGLTGQPRANHHEANTPAPLTSAPASPGRDTPRTA